MQCICAGCYKGSEDILAGLSSLSDKAHGSGSVQNKQNSRSINLYSDHCNRFFYFELHAVLSSADILNSRPRIQPFGSMIVGNPFSLPFKMLMLKGAGVYGNWGGGSCLRAYPAPFGWLLPSGGLIFQGLS